MERVFGDIIFFLILGFVLAWLPFRMWLKGIVFILMASRGFSGDYFLFTSSFVVGFGMGWLTFPRDFFFRSNFFGFLQGGRESRFFRRRRDGKRKFEEELQKQANEKLRAEKIRFEEELYKEKERLRRESAERESRRSKEKSKDDTGRTSVDDNLGDPYKILGLRRGADLAEIKKARVNLAKKYHPDLASNTTDEIKELAEEKMKAINWAYESLTK